MTASAAPTLGTTLTAPLSRAGLGQPQIAQLGAAMVAFAALLFLPQVFNDGDTYWHLAAGEWMLAHGQVLHRDVFSFSHLGKPWQAHEWLSEILMAASFRAGSWTGLLLFYAAASALGAMLLARGVARSLNGVTLAVVLAVAATCTTPSLLARPHLLALPILIAWTAELIAARDAGRGPRLFMVGLMLLWANLHGSYVFGPVLYGPLALEALVAAPPSARLKTFRDWGLVGVLCAGAMFVTPDGWVGFIHPFQIMTMKNLNAIAEWRPANFAKFTSFEAALLATLFVGLGRGVKVPPLRLAVLLLMLHMTLQHERHQIVLAVTAPLLLARPFAEALGQRPATPAGGRTALMMFMVAAIVMVGFRIAEPVVRPDGAVTPATALAHVPPALAARPVLNNYGDGGYLIFRGVRPFIDGRADMYGDAYFARYLKIVAGDGALFDAAVKQYGIAWTLFTPDEPIVRFLDAKPGWRRLYADKYAVVHVRDDAMPKVAPAAAAR
jgi:hypothetical protein